MKKQLLPLLAVGLMLGGTSQIKAMDPCLALHLLSRCAIHFYNHRQPYLDRQEKLDYMRGMTYQPKRDVRIQRPIDNTNTLLHAIEIDDTIGDDQQPVLQARYWYDTEVRHSRIRHQMSQYWTIWGYQTICWYHHALHPGDKVREHVVLNTQPLIEYELNESYHNYRDRIVTQKQQVLQQYAHLLPHPQYEFASIEFKGVDAQTQASKELKAICMPIKITDNKAVKIIKVIDEKEDEIINMPLPATRDGETPAQYKAHLTDETMLLLLKCAHDSKLDIKKITII